LYPALDMQKGCDLAKLLERLPSLSKAFDIAMGFTQGHIVIGMQAAIEDLGLAGEVEKLRVRRGQNDQGWDLIGTWAVQYRVMMSHARTKYDQYQTYCCKLIKEVKALTDMEKQAAIRNHPHAMVELYKKITATISKVI
jgi:hypothetical protein